MSLGDVNFILILFTIVFFSLVVNVNTALHLLLTAEIMWVTLYIFAVVTGFIYNNLNLISLTFFFLIFSAVELGIGLVLVLIQTIFFRTTHLNVNQTNPLKFNTRFLNKLRSQALNS